MLSPYLDFICSYLGVSVIGLFLIVIIIILIIKD